MHLKRVTCYSIPIQAQTSSLQLRADFFNLSNTRNFGIPEARINNTGWGLSGNTNGGNRRIVMMLRYTF